MAKEVGCQNAEKAREETVEVVLAEAERSMSRQLQFIDGLDSKASQLFQLITLATTLLSIAGAWLFQKEGVGGLLPCWFVLAVFVIVVVLYLSAVYCVVQASRVRVYYLPMKMDPEHIRSTYLSLTKSEAQEQLLANYIKYSQDNLGVAGDKARWVDIALVIAAIDISLLIAAIAIGTLMAWR